MRVKDKIKKDIERFYYHDVIKFREKSYLSSDDTENN